ncbi:sulfite exporter TauE/SafE family protein [Aestuariimicrobium soli]|uniref:sulfite exporter TauE/SafE family protein n=1 Tax=Aestuariimicrobium soli TaxID=2035834 RepID=UPI003EBBE042
MFWLTLVVAALLIGISKTSVGGLGSVSVAMFALVMPTKESTAAVLLLLIVGDIVAVLRYRAHADWKLLVKLLPWVIPGLALGALFLRLVDDLALTRVIGAMLLVMLVIQLVTRWRPRRRPDAGIPSGPGTPSGTGEPAPEPTSWAQTKVAAGGAGILAGFTTMTANAAGPVMTLYLLAARIDKLRFVGTGAWYFLIINLTKVPFSAALGLFTRETLLHDLYLVPVVLAGTFLGTKLLAVMPQKVFENVAIIASGIGAVSLLLK